MTAANPKLRHVDIQPATQGGRTGIAVRDPLGISDHTLFIPQALTPLLALCDGSRDIPTLRTALMLRTGVQLSDLAIQDFVQQLDNALFLEGDLFAAAHELALDEYRNMPSRPCTGMGGSYPVDANELSTTLEQYLSIVPLTDKGRARNVRGLVCPHIDFPRGGPTYAEVWQAARKAVQEIEIAIVFGTDHHSENDLLTLTRQSYATPWGTLDTDMEAVEAITSAVGASGAFRGELRHRKEHSIESALVWLHYLLGERKCSIVPLLCGSFHRFIKGDDDILTDGTISHSIEILKGVIAGRRSLVIAAADLAHVGPAFGGLLPVDAVERARQASADQKLMETICAGDAQGFYQQIKDEGDVRNICGLPPIYWSLRLLESAEGEVTGYQQCPADHEGTSIVSICGIVLKHSYIEA
ncbi:AmmeMemoRadiSam system protein B [Chloroflexota bacterium]